jgi:1-acyl-sn-glycerol-3-phosphate acyltransferase
MFSDRRFWPIFWAQFWGAFNDNVFKNALVILIAYKSYNLMGLKTDQMVALCGGIFIFPFFLFSAMAGQVADKIPKHRLTVIIKLWEVLVMVLGTVGFITQNILLLLISLFLMGMQSTFFGPIKYSILPELINEHELTEGTALVQMGTFVSILVGTIIGGVLISIEGLGSYWVSATVIMIAILGLLFSMKIQKLTPNDSHLKIDFNIFRSTWHILKISREVPSVFQSVLGISWFWFFGAAMLSIFPIYVKDYLGANEHVVTLFLACFSIGVAIGSFLCEKFSGRIIELGLVPFGSLGLSLFTGDLFFAHWDHQANADQLLSFTQFLSLGSSYRILFNLLMLSVFSGFFIVPLYTFIQHRSKKEVRSRIIAANNILNAILMVASAIFLTVLYGWELSLNQIFLILAIMNLAVAFYIYTVIPEFLWRFLCVIVARCIYRVKIKGIENIPDEGAAVLVCNHLSFVDWLIIASGVHRPIRFIMHYSFINLPVIKYFFRGAKVIPIAGKKEDEEVLENAYQQIAKDLAAGELVCIFPEGVVTRDGETATYKNGIEKIVQQTPVPVIPMVLDGLWGSFFSRRYAGKAMSNPKVIIKTFASQVDLKILESIPAENVTAKSLEELTVNHLKHKN